MGNGYWNRVLRVDLSAGRTWTETVGDEVWKAFTGGSGYGAKVILEEATAETDPLGPENPLVFAVGAYQAGFNPGNAKWSVVAKSPLTGTYGDSAGGADFGVALKRAGYDALVVKGAADRPVYLVVDEDRVEIRDAENLWGLDAYDATDAVKAAEKDSRYSVACIGPAGERLVKIACIVADGHSFAGRCGLGAVMGSKRLKAVAVKGNGSVQVADPEGVKRLSRRLFREIAAAARANGLREHGTPNLCITAEAFGDMPIKYWSGDVWPEGAKKIGAPNYTEVLKAKPLPCANCPAGCHRIVEVTEPAEYAVRGPGPEYETLGMLGSNLLIDDPKAIAKANDVCNRLGIDTISAGGCVGFAMECFERGWLSREETGIDLAWGDGDAAIELLAQIGRRDGFGAVFADGTLAAAKKMHPEAERLVAHVKGLDLPAHDARACWSLAVNYATSTRGACHMRGAVEDVEMGGFFVPELGIVKDWSRFFVPEHKSELAVKLQDYGTWMNSLVICAFMVDGGELSMTSLVELFNAVTGWGWSIDDAMKAGARIFNAQRLVNLRDGHGRHTDTIPLKMTIPAMDGFRAGKAPVPFDAYLNEYYALRRWDERGRPTRECLEDLGLLDYAAAAGI
ncbi:MAG: aldehyde ferredoxin oxidoreductase family protein [Firmicutes bacterium]|nr:aldehyde ferredoxin oxidoreductase family protein [Bacillota bacterium]